jgi:two-component system KDP operon response regulator KdpE
MTQPILIIDDELHIRRFLAIALEAQGYTVVPCEDGQSGLQQAALLNPQLILLDLGLPDMSGLEVLARLREWSTVPVMILSVQDQERDKVKALDLGADDYLTKPFGVQELLARIRVALRHRQANPVVQSVFAQGPLKVDLAARTVWFQEQPVKLTKTEYNLLALLVRHAGKVLTHRQILSEVWGAEYVSETHYLQVYLSRLRNKLELDPSQPRYFLTEAGVGYRFALMDHSEI